LKIKTLKENEEDKESYWLKENLKVKESLGKIRIQKVDPFISTGKFI
jgi:hypothetical protein